MASHATTTMQDRGCARGARRRGVAAARSARAIAALLGALAGLTGALPARAQAAPPVDRARMTEDMHAYFRGEKGHAPLFFSAGLASGVIGTVLVTRDDDLARGAAYPVLGVGLVELIVGATIFLRTDAQVARLDEQLARDPAAFKREEAARIGKVSTQFTALMIVESVLLAGGLATAIVATEKGCCRTLQGVGFGLAGQSAVVLALDLFASARARDYADSLDRFEPGSAAPAPAGRRAPLGFGPITIGGRF